MATEYPERPSCQNRLSEPLEWYQEEFVYQVNDENDNQEYIVITAEDVDKASVKAIDRAIAAEAKRTAADAKRTAADAAFEIFDLQASAADEDEPRFLYDRKGAARQLSISVRTLDYLTANKKLATRRIGKKVLIPRSELSRFARTDHFGPVNVSCL